MPLDRPTHLPSSCPVMPVFLLPPYLVTCLPHHLNLSHKYLPLTPQSTLPQSSTCHPNLPCHTPPNFFHLTVSHANTTERVTGRKARGLQVEKRGCRCQTFLSLLSGRKKQTSDMFSSLYKFKRRFLSHTHTHPITIIP